MATTNLDKFDAAADGVELTWDSSPAPDITWAAGWQSVLIVANASASAIDVTIERPGTVDGEALGDRVVAVGAGTTVLIGNLDPAIYAQADGQVYATLSATTDISLLNLEA